MIKRDVPVECGGVEVHPGDLVFGDVDGVVVVPSAIATEAISLALDKINGENKTREELAHGLKLSEVYAKYGVL